MVMFVLFCLQLSSGRLHSVILTIRIPAIHSCRKVKVCLDETVGELIRLVCVIMWKEGWVKDEVEMGRVYSTVIRPPGTS